MYMFIVLQMSSDIMQLNFHTFIPVLMFFGNFKIKVDNTYLYVYIFFYMLKDTS